jgi:esterase/lipase
MNTTNKKICFILLPGFAPDNVPVLGLRDVLKKHGYEVIATNFFGDIDVTDFSYLTSGDCIANISKIINDASSKYDSVFGIGISLGGALLLEHAKNHHNLDGIVSIGTPFKLKNEKLIGFWKILFPFIYPAWRRLQRYKKLRLIPVGAGSMVVKYLKNGFLENLESIHTPILFLHSKKDNITDYRALEKFSSIISSPKQEITYFNNGNHVINYDLESIVTHSLDFFGLNAEEKIPDNVSLDSPSPVYIRNF